MSSQKLKLKNTLSIYRVNNRQLLHKKLKKHLNYYYYFIPYNPTNQKFFL